VSDAAFIKKIGRMTERELFWLVLDEPTLLTDSYYIKFRNAIMARAKELGVL